MAEVELDRLMSLVKLSSSVYTRVHPERMPSCDSNKGYIVCEDYVIVVDTTYFVNDFRHDLEELKKITGLRVGYVINTHYHADHSYGNDLFKCDIIAQSQCPRLMKKVRKKQIAELLQEERDPEVTKHLKRLRLRYPTILFDGFYQIDSNPRIQIVHLGGHSPDLSVVYLPEERILFASDDLFGSKDPSIPSHPFMSARSNLNQWILALREILGLQAGVIVPGHFGVCNNEAVRGLTEYLELFVKNVRELKMQGYSKEEVKRRPELLNLPRLSAARWIQNNVEMQYDRL